MMAVGVMKRKNGQDWSQFVGWLKWLADFQIRLSFMARTS